jgi:hypothetical protein
MLRPDQFGAEAMIGADRAYRGSRFSEVRDAVLANPYREVWDGPGRLPTYNVSLRSVLHGLLPFGRNYVFRQATTRAVDSRADLRWGPDGRGFRRLLHPNGICLFGVWAVTEPTEYSGYFRQGNRALVIARYSTCCSETRRGHARSLSLVAKLFPTTDPDHQTPLETASLFTQQDIGGDYSNYINDVELRNAPNTTSWRRGNGIPVLLVTGAIFNVVDREPTIRQLYEIAELDKPADEPTRAPAFLRLLVSEDQLRIEGEALDFRDELTQQIFDKSDPVPRRRLTFNVEVTDEGETHGTAALQWRTFRGWRRIGTLIFDNAVASYNGDFVIHFHHPTWRKDRNDPSTATRVNEQKRSNRFRRP